VRGGSWDSWVIKLYFAKSWFLVRFDAVMKQEVYTFMALMIIYFLNGIIDSIEAIWPVSRALSLAKNNLSAGYALNGFLRLFARLSNIILMPVFGLISDLGLISNSSIFCILLSPVSTIALAVFLFPLRNKVYLCINNMLETIKTSGQIFAAKKPESYKLFLSNSVASLYSFKIELYESLGIVRQEFNNYKNFDRKAKSYLRKSLIAYIPYYLALPVTVFCVSAFPNYRATLISMASLANGITSIYIAVKLDPYLASKEEDKSFLINFYPLLATSRVVSALIANLLFLFASLSALTLLK
jgi:hypothetical protein